MSPEEFFALPPAIALRVLYDCLDEATVAAIRDKAKPKLPLPPKYDQAIYRRDGVQWASETDLEGLLYWRKKSSESAAGGGQYADNDRKRAEALARWIAWRECYPEAAWSGERNRDNVTAEPPSSKPAVYPRTGGGQRRAPPEPDDGFGPMPADDDIPF